MEQDVAVCVGMFAVDSCSQLLILVTWMSKNVNASFFSFSCSTVGKKLHVPVLSAEVFMETIRSSCPGGQTTKVSSIYLI